MLGSHHDANGFLTMAENQCLTAYSVIHLFNEHAYKFEVTSVGNRN